MKPTLALAQALIARPSLTPDDQGCQALIAERLQPLGFECQTIAANGVSNLWAIRRGSAGAAAKTLVFAGHTDVVPTGPLEQWTSPPFVPTERDAYLYGRGAADMKTSVAGFVVAAEELVRHHPRHAGSLALLITSDEEGPARDGTVRVVEALRARGERLDYCIVGEPTCVERFGDMIKNGRRGSLSGKMTVHGVQGHIAYPHLARNPVHLIAPALADMAAHVWDHGNEHFQPTSWQISNFHAGTGAGNVIPGQAVVDFNFRFSTEHDMASLQQGLSEILTRHGLCQPDDVSIEWTLGAQPFLTPPGELSRTLTRAITQETGVEPALSTTGGTSDGRFLAPVCEQVVEFGPINASIHKIDEHVEIDCIEKLKNIYFQVASALLA